jgi:TonB family protein
LLLIDWWRPAPHPEERAMPVALVATATLPSKEPLAMPALPSPHPFPAAVPTPEAAPLAPASDARVQPPPEPSEEKTAAPPAASPPPQPEAVKPPSPPAVKPIAPSSRKKAPAPPEQPKRVVREAPADAPASGVPMPGVAVYDVVVDARGKIRSVTLAHSSGTTSFDASGEAMIRNGIGFEPPADGGSGPQVFTVTIAFTPEGH